MRLLCRKSILSYYQLNFLINLKLYFCADNLWIIQSFSYSSSYIGKQNVQEQCHLFPFFCICQIFILRCCNKTESVVIGCVQTQFANSAREQRFMSFCHTCPLQTLLRNYFTRSFMLIQSLNILWPCIHMPTSRQQEKGTPHAWTVLAEQLKCSFSSQSW